MTVYNKYGQYKNWVMGDEEATCDLCTGPFLKRVIEQHQIIITMEKITEKVFSLDGDTLRFCSRRCQDGYHNIHRG